MITNQPACIPLILFYSEVWINGVVENMQENKQKDYHQPFSNFELLTELLLINLPSYT